MTSHEYKCNKLTATASRWAHNNCPSLSSALFWGLVHDNRVLSKTMCLKSTSLSSNTLLSPRRKHVRWDKRPRVHVLLQPKPKNNFLPFVGEDEAGLVMPYHHLKSWQCNAVLFKLIINDSIKDFYSIFL